MTRLLPIRTSHNWRLAALKRRQPTQLCKMHVDPNTP